MRVFGRALWACAGLVVFLVALGLLSSGCFGHIFGLPFLAIAEVEEAECKAHLPAGAKDPSDGGAMIYACTRPADGGASGYELLATNCSDIPDPPAVGSWRCGLDGGRSYWNEEIYRPQGESWPQCDAGECGGTSELTDSPTTQ